MRFEKTIIESFLRNVRVKLAEFSDYEIGNHIDDIKKRFLMYFRIRKLDSIISALNDKEKLRYYINQHNTSSRN
jgi:hypothetical protein